MLDRAFSKTYVRRMEDPGLTAARDAVGGKNIDLAKLLGVTESAVSQWKKVPYQRAIEIEEKTEGRVTRHDIRPDVFGPAPKKRRAA